MLETETQHITQHNHTGLQKRKSMHSNLTIQINPNHTPPKTPVVSPSVKKETDALIETLASIDKSLLLFFLFFLKVFSLFFCFENSTVECGNEDYSSTFDPHLLDFEREKVIGSGTFGVVTKAPLKNNSGYVAIKRVVVDPHFKVCF